MAAAARLRESHIYSVSSSRERERSALCQAGHVPFPSPRVKSGRWSGFLCRRLIAQLSRCAKSIVPKFAADHSAFLTGGVLVSRRALTQFTFTQTHLSVTKHSAPLPACCRREHYRSLSHRRVESP